MIQVKGTIKGTPDKDTYESEIEIEGYGIVKAQATRFVNEPKEGDEVWCIIFDEIFNNAAIYIPLQVLGDEHFIGMARQGFKIEFADDKLEITSQNVTIDLKDNSFEVKNGSASLKGEGSQLTISGFTTGITMRGTVAPTGSGPFCGLPNCLFSGAPHVGDKVMAN